MNQSLNGFEALEDRVLLAGNVTLAFNAGVLTITGDGLSNNVHIVDVDSDGLYEIVNGDGTTNIINNGVLDGNGDPPRSIRANTTSVTQL